MLTVLSADDIKHALPMTDAVEAMKRAFAAYSNGSAIVPQRIHLDIEKHEAMTLVMPSFVSGSGGRSDVLATKVVSLFPDNPNRGIAFIQAAVLVLEPDTGRAIALLEGGTITAIRTGAASGAATDFLATLDASTCAIFGAGVQARTQLEAVCTVRKIETAWVYSRTPEKTDALIADLAGKGPIPADLRRAESPREAVKDADVICTATASTREPVFDNADLKPDVHINAVGSSQPHVVEIPPETVTRSFVVVDSREAAMEEAGDISQPVESGRIGWDHVRAELGELASKPGYGPPARPTFFKSVGLAVQDAMAAQVALENAERLGLGTKVEF